MSKKKKHKVRHKSIVKKKHQSLPVVTAKKEEKEISLPVNESKPFYTSFKDTFAKPLLWWHVFSIIFFEITYKLSTDMFDNWFPQIIYILLFAIIFGLCIYMLISFFQYRTQRILSGIWFLACYIFTASSYFIYAQFKVHYDPFTVMSGAKDALGQFQDATFDLIFNIDGLSKLAIFSIPFLAYLYYFYKTKEDNDTKLPSQGRLQVLYATIVCAIVNYGLISSNSIFYSQLSNEYSYQNAVSSFGVFSSTILDLTHIAVPTKEAVFEKADVESVQAQEEVAPTEIVYQDNVLDLQINDTSDSMLTSLDQYVFSLTPSKQNEYTGLFEGKNLIMITAEAFSQEVIDEELTPTLYRLANKGIQFLDYYQPTSAGTTGGEFEVLFGSLPLRGGSSLKLTQDYHNVMTIGAQLDRLGYNGWAFHNNDYMFYDRHLTHNNLGYSNGFMGMGNGMEEFVSNTWPESDLEMFEGTFPMYCDQEPFNVYYMTVSGHSGYDYDNNYLTRKHWDRIKDLDYSDRVKGYLAANLDLEDGLTYLVNALEEKGIADDTVIVLSADHFPYGLDDGESLQEALYLSELYGYPITNYLQRDHNRLIIWSGCLEDEAPIVVNTPTMSLDILPTLSNLFNTKWDSRLFVGRDVFSDALPLVFNINYDFKTDLGTYLSGSGEFIPKDDTVKVDEEYIQNIRTIVRNKMNYCEGICENDYFHHVFPDY